MCREKVHNLTFCHQKGLYSIIFIIIGNANNKKKFNCRKQKESEHRHHGNLNLISQIQTVLSTQNDESVY